MSGEGGAIEPGQIRVSPDSRLPARSRRNYGILRDVRLAWVLTGQAVARLPLFFLAVTTIWGAIRWLCLQGLRQAHLGLLSADSIADFDFWARIGLLADLILVRFGPIILFAVMLPPVHRMILEAPSPSWSRAAARTGKILAAILCLALLLALDIGLCAGVPAALRGVLGSLSTLLLAILLLPLGIAAAVTVFRFTFGLPAVSLGLPRGMAEGWMISRNHVVRALCVAGLSALPLIVLALIWLFVLRDPLGWPSSIFRPVVQVLSVTLTACVTGLLYRAYRLPAALRPDLRPSSNRNQRRPPVFT
jgi:hypothetical protein